MKDIRWKQRFHNFEKAFLQFREAVERFDQLDDLAKEGLIQRFEYTLELSWKTMKDYLEAEGLIAKTPRETIKQAFQANLINNGEIWMEMLDKRNIMAHTYDEKNFKEVLEDIVGRFYGEVEEVYGWMKEVTS